MKSRKSIAVVGLVLLTVSLSTQSSTAWITVPVVNPGAESGDMSGWDTFNNQFIAINDPSVAFNGSHYFFSQASRTSGNGLAFSQEVDVSSLTGSILDAEATVAFRYQTGQRWGFDAETATSYLYDWKASFQTNSYSDAGHLFGIGFSLSPDDQWATVTIPFHLRGDWETARESLTRIKIQGGAIYSAVDSSAPGSWQIETWENWVGSEPTFLGFDSFSVSVEVVPIPAALPLFTSAIGLLGYFGLSGKKPKPV